MVSGVSNKTFGATKTEGKENTPQNGKVAEDPKKAEKAPDAKSSMFSPPKISPWLQQALVQSQVEAHPSPPPAPAETNPKTGKMVIE